MSVSKKISTNQNYQIICQDALVWLKNQQNHSLGNIITGIPDMDETPFKKEEYINFVQRALLLMFKKIKKDGYCLLMNTDRKIDKTWLDKSYLIQSMAEKAKIPLKWHKIILLRPVGSTHLQRPTYQHYLCFSYEAGPGEATPDVMTCGQRAYKNASCPNGVQHALKFIKRYSKSLQIVDPFVGQGTVLKMAQNMKAGFTGIGVDLDPKQCELTKKLLKIE